MPDKDKPDVKIGTKEEAKWDKVLKQATAAIEQAELEKEINKAVVELAESKIKAEQD